MGGKRFAGFVGPGAALSKAIISFLTHFVNECRILCRSGYKPSIPPQTTLRSSKESVMFLGIQSFPLRALLVSGLIATTSVTSLAQGPATERANNAAATKAVLARDYGRISLSFEANE